MTGYTLTIRISFQENELGLQNWHEVKGGPGADLEANVVTHGQQALQNN